MIRNATTLDIGDIERIENSSFATPWSRTSIEAEFYKDYAHCFIDEQNGCVAGYIFVWGLENEWELITIAVDEKFRREKVATRLLEHVLELSGSNAVWHLEVACDNSVAINFYKKHGFVETGRIKDYYDAGKDAFRMNCATGSL